MKLKNRDFEKRRRKIYIKKKLEVKSKKFGFFYFFNYAKNKIFFLYLAQLVLNLFF